MSRSVPMLPEPMIAAFFLPPLVVMEGSLAGVRSAVAGTGYVSMHRRSSEDSRRSSEGLVDALRQV
jgi:hypothetical protein